MGPWARWGIAAVAAMWFCPAALGLITAQPSDASGNAIPAGWGVWFRVAMLGAVPLVIALLWAGDVIRPASFRRRHAAAASNQSWGVLLLSAFLVMLGGVVAAQIVFATVAVWAGPVSPDTDRGRGILTIAHYAAGAPLALFVAGLVAAKGARSLFALRDPGVGLLTLALAFPLVSLAAEAASRIALLLSGRPPAPIAHESLNRMVHSPEDVWVRVLMAGAVIGAPIVEEVLYRLMLQGAMVRLLKGPWRGVLAASALFACAHLSGGTVPWHALPPLFVLGVALGVVHLRTGRLGPCIAAHMGFNAVNIAIALASRGPAAGEISSPP